MSVVLTISRIFTVMLFVVATMPPRSARAGDNVDQWIADLTSDEWRVRQRALEKLVGQGEDAIPRLAKLVESSNDGEVRTRASAAISQIEENRKVGASLITMKLDNVPVAQALAELSRQARAPILTEPANLLEKSTRRVSLNFDHRPFWDVMLQLSAQAGLEVTGVTRRNREAGLGVTPGGVEWSDKPIVLSGPLLIRADRLVRVSTTHLKPPVETSEEFNISLTVFAEPKLKVLDTSSTLKLDEVVDERGNSLIPPADANVPANVNVFGNQREGYTSHWDVGAALHHPKGTGQRIARFRATTSLQVRTRAAVVEVPLAGGVGGKNASRTVDGLRMKVKSIDAGHCDLSIDRDGRTDPEWYTVRMQVAMSEADLVDDKGQAVAHSPNGADADESPDNQRLDVHMRFVREVGEDGNKGARKTAASEAVKMRWEIPVETRELTVPFELRDLPIP